MANAVTVHRRHSWTFLQLQHKTQKINGYQVCNDQAQQGRIKVMQANWILDEVPDNDHARGMLQWSSYSASTVCKRTWIEPCRSHASLQKPSRLALELQIDAANLRSRSVQTQSRLNATIEFFDEHYSQCSTPLFHFLHAAERRNGFPAFQMESGPLFLQMNPSGQVASPFLLQRNTCSSDSAADPLFLLQDHSNRPVVLGTIPMLSCGRVRVGRNARWVFRRAGAPTCSGLDHSCPRYSSYFD